MGRGGVPSWADGLGWTGVREYLNFFDPLQIFKAAQILKAGLLLNSRKWYFEFYVSIIIIL
jgi:hypothetical protein